MKISQFKGEEYIETDIKMI